MSDMGPTQRGFAKTATTRGPSHNQWLKEDFTTPHRLCRGLQACPTTPPHLCMEAGKMKKVKRGRGTGKTTCSAPTGGKRTAERDQGEEEFYLVQVGRRRSGLWAYQTRVFDAYQNLVPLLERYDPRTSRKRSKILQWYSLWYTTSPAQVGSIVLDFFLQPFNFVLPGVRTV